MKIKYLLVVLLALWISLQSANAQNVYADIKDYKVFYGIIARNEQNLLVTRTFENAGKRYLLLVNPQTLETEIIKSDAFDVEPMSQDRVREFFKNTPYILAIKKAEEQSAGLQNAGIIKGSSQEQGITLTTDLCPSHRPLDRVAFTETIKAFEKVETPVPVAISVSGLWMTHHAADLKWLKQMQTLHQLSITWVNHSYYHRFDPKLPLKKNFLLEPGTDINFEVLETEKAMLKNGVLPSVFFRFPGLVSSRELVFKITGFGLIPIGSDAWLAKGQKPKDGSLVLIHVNGNEPVGVNDFIRLLQSKNIAIAKKQWILYDLPGTIVNKFKNKGLVQ